MSDNPVETTATEAQPSTPVPATPPAPDVEAIKKSVRLETLREAQSKKDQEIARLHRQHQEELRQLRETVRTPLQKAGYEPDAVLDDFDVRQKAARLDSLEREAQQAAAWQQHVTSTAAAFGLDPNDPRLDISDVDPNKAAAEIVNRARAAMLEEAAKERDRAMADARKAATAAAQAKVDNGDLDVLGGAPNAPAPGLMDQYNKEMQAARGKGMAAGSAIRDKYRAKGLRV